VPEPDLDDAAIQLRPWHRVALLDRVSYWWIGGVSGPTRRVILVPEVNVASTIGRKLSRCREKLEGQ
jgi:hypothetical protein